MVLSATSCTELTAAQDRIRHLEISRDALFSSVASLKVLISNERIMTRVMKRRLGTALTSTQPVTCATDQLQADTPTRLDNTQLCKELEQSRAAASHAEEELEGALHGSQSLKAQLELLATNFERKQAQFETMCDSNRDHETRLAAMTKKLDSCTTHLNERELECLILRDQLSHLEGGPDESEPDESEPSSNSSDIKTDSVEYESETHDSEYERLKESLAEAQSKITALENALRREEVIDDASEDGSCSALKAQEINSGNDVITESYDSVFGFDGAKSLAELEMETATEIEQNEVHVSSDGLFKTHSGVQMDYFGRSSHITNENDTGGQSGRELLGPGDQGESPLYTQIKSQLSTTREECETLRRKIREELEPALSMANQSLDEKNIQLEHISRQFEQDKTAAHESISALETKLHNTSERLDKAVFALNETEARLAKSEQSDDSHKEQLTSLTKEKEKYAAEISQLHHERNSERKSLFSMQECLTQAEGIVAGYKQSAQDVQENNERLSELLSEAYDRQEVAEKRAVRKDRLAFDIEKRCTQLERDYSFTKSNCDEAMLKLESCGIEVRDLNRALEVKEGALKEQTELIHKRETSFASKTKELQDMVSCRDEELRVSKNRIIILGRKVTSLEEQLVESRSSHDQTQDCLAAVKQLCSDAEDQNGHHIRTIERLQAELATLSESHSAAKATIAQRKEAFRTQGLELAEKMREMAALATKKEELENTLRGTTRDLGAERSKTDSLRSAKAKLETDIRNAELNVSSYQEDLSQRSAEIESLSRNHANVQSQVTRLEIVVSNKSDEVETNKKHIRALENALERSKQQRTAVESLLEGHDTLLEDSREREEALAISASQLLHAEERIAQLENDLKDAESRLSSRVQELDCLAKKISKLEEAKDAIETKLAVEQAARTSTTESLNKTTATLMATEKLREEDVTHLEATITSLREVLEEKDSSLRAASEEISHRSNEHEAAKEQLSNSRVREDHLFSKLNATEQELALRTESVAALEVRFGELQDTLTKRESELDRLEESFMDRNQALLAAQSRIEGLTSKIRTISRGELQTMQTKLEEKEKSIANLHNWCCFINGKLHAAGKELSQREMGIDASSATFKKLETEVSRLKQNIIEKESCMRKLESMRVVETSDFRSRIQSLQEQVQEANAEIQKARSMTSVEEVNKEPRLMKMADELRESKQAFERLTTENATLRAHNVFLQTTMSSDEKYMASPGGTRESQGLDLAHVRGKSCTATSDIEDSETDLTADSLKLQSETGYLLVQLKRVEAELFAANECADMWHAKAEELRPIAEATLEAQEALESISTRLAVSETEAQNKIDLLETQLNEAIRERNAAERNFSVAASHSAAMRARCDPLGRNSLAEIVSHADILSRVSFTLDGLRAPGSDVIVYIVGGDAGLGEWNASRRIPLHVVGQGVEGIIRQCDVVLHSNLVTTYKYVADGANGELVWEGGEDRSLRLEGGSTHELRDSWRSAT